MSLSVVVVVLAAAAAVDFGWGSTTDPFQRSPDPLGGFNGAYI